ncbi:DNA alkylation repair protein [Microbacterium sp. SLBN-146]|uniref:DNA alkylation repair protein n=1 Tax=Microbacterium sp. SLBN-146 TaxID=2768457 RepID=UPI00114E0B10|nr:DNA alkylation repair protein [Microbacterium sp. SLBN-146]TQJ32155.1 3-methyladenine DNA glycosylase AlkD [Microbacterium sp. SLBN-146]
MDADGTELIAVIRHRLRGAADPSRAAGQQAYMKSEMPFLGVGVPEVRRITRTVLQPDADVDHLRTAALALWDEATHREERYAAMAILDARQLRGSWTLVPVIEHMVRTGRWWDYTDELSHRLADLHDAFPAETASLVREWSTDDDMWMRRIAIISQLGRRDRVDAELLASVIDPNLSDPQFFVRKAIGWALREYARVAPDWVSEYAATHALSPLSRREALKHLPGV